MYTLTAVTRNVEQILYVATKKQDLYVTCPTGTHGTENQGFRKTPPRKICWRHVSADFTKRWQAGTVVVR